MKNAETPPVRRPYSETVAKVITVPPIETVSDLVALLKEVLATVSWHEEQVGVGLSWQNWCIPCLMSSLTASKIDASVTEWFSATELSRGDVDGADFHFIALGKYDVVVDGMEFRIRVVGAVYESIGIMFPGLPILIQYNERPF